MCVRRYDSLTGVPSCQRTLAFEKGSVLFNIGALHTQMGARQDRSAAQGIDQAVDAFQRAAGGGAPTPAGRRSLWAEPKPPSCVQVPLTT